MKSPLLLAGAAAVGLLAANNGALAQSVGVRIGPFGFYSGPSYYYDDYYAYPPTGARVYGYYGNYDDDGVRVYRRHRCGTYRYWNGERCVVGELDDK